MRLEFILQEKFIPVPWNGKNQTLMVIEYKNAKQGMPAYTSRFTDF